MKLTFVSGTGTDVGKTYVTAQLALSLARRGVRAGVYKPVASGCIGTDTNSSERISSDADQLTAALQRPVDPDLICPQRFLAPLAPDEAARQEGRRVDPDLLFEGAKRWATECEHLLVEGAGGLFSPIADELLNLDLFLKLRTDPEFETELVLVAPNRLGVIHETLATVRAAIAQSAAIDRIYLTATQPQSDQSGQTNAAQLRHWLPEQKIVTVDWNGTVE